MATAVGNAAIKDGVAQIEAPDDLEAYMADRMWCVSQADYFLGSCSVRYIKRRAVMSGCSCAAIITVIHALPGRLEPAPSAVVLLARRHPQNPLKAAHSFHPGQLEAELQ